MKKNQLIEAILENSPIGFAVRKLSTGERVLANLSHEFRTPINGILGISEIMTNELQGSEMLELTEAIQNSGRRLNFRLNSIMLLSQLSSHSFQIRLSEMDFENEISSLIKECGVHASARKLQFSYNSPAKEIIVSADKELLHIVIANLLDNAVKFTRHGSINVSLRHEESEAGLFAVLCIEDTCIGIAEENQKLIFQRPHAMNNEINCMLSIIPASVRLPVRHF